jgi:hypothetical protein
MIWVLYITFLLLFVLKYIGQLIVNPTNNYKGTINIIVIYKC